MLDVRGVEVDLYGNAITPAKLAVLAVVEPVAENDSGSQRDENFKGGIQKGTNATDAVAKKLDKQCKTISETISKHISVDSWILGGGLTMQKKLRQDQIPGGIGACAPDGGAWFKDGKLVAVFEGKKQGIKGNAIERWFKNSYICRLINPDVCYVTFSAGEGAADGRVLQKTLAIAHLSGHNGGPPKFNQFNPNNNSTFFSVEGFTDDFIRDVMLEVLGYCAKND